MSILGGKNKNFEKKGQDNIDKLDENKELNIIRKFAEGRITLNECYDKLVDREEFDLQDILSEKIDKEFAKYCNSLKEKTQQEIIDSAYEIVSKEAIKEYLKYCDLADKEIAIMIDQNDLLNEFYHDWLDTDDDFYESMEYSINDSIAAVTRYYNKQQKLRIERDDK